MPTSLTLPLMTAEQFFELPEPVGDFTWELHFGELIQVGRPKKKHFNLQMLIRDILARELGREQWLIEIEMPYGLTAGYDVRASRCWRFPAQDMECCAGRGVSDRLARTRRTGQEQVKPRSKDG
jgi:hypothetical protein